MIWEHYVFGQARRDNSAPTADFVNQLLDSAQQAQAKLNKLNIEQIMAVISRAGELWADDNYGPRKLAIQHMPTVTGFSPEMVALGLNELSHLCSLASLQAIVSGELRGPDSLNGVAADLVSGCQIHCEPLGILLHVSPGNVFLGAADSLIRGLLTKNVNILKVSSGDPLFPMLMAQSLKDADPQGILAKSFAIISFQGGDSELEDIFKQRCNGVVVWGGEAAVQAWQSHCPLGLRLICYGPRLSFALITQAYLNEVGYEQAAKSLALDTVMWEQRGCGSPQMVFVPQNCEVAFAQHLVEALQSFAHSLPPAQLSRDEQIEILKERELAKFGELTGTQAAWYPQGSQQWTVLLRRDFSRLGSPLNRTAVVYPYQEVTEVVQALEPQRAILQSVGLGAVEGQVQELSRQLFALGVNRITPVGRMHTTISGAPHDGSFQLDRLVRWTAIEGCFSSHDLVHSPGQEAPGALPPALAKVVNFARANSKFYADRLGSCPIETKEQFSKLPLLTGEDVRLAAPPVSDAILTGPLTNAYIFGSGGSTGAPKFTVYSTDDWKDIAKTLAFIYSTAGISAQDTVANLFMAGNLYTSFIAVNNALELIGCTNLAIAGNALIDQTISYFQLFKPTAVVGLPSIIMQLAETMHSRGISQTIDKVLYGGEHLSLEARQFLHKVWNTTSIMSAGYATVDAGTVGYQCLYCENSVHHLLSDCQYLEALNPDTGESLPSGETGELVVTCLNRHLMPVIRYKTGDLGRIIERCCPCGASHQLFELKGRSGSVLRVGTVNIYPESIASVIAHFAEVGHLFQIEANQIEGKDALLIRVEKLTNSPLPSAINGQIRQAIINSNYELDEALREGWLHSLQVEITEPNGIPRIARTGKIRQSVDLRQA